MTKTLEEWSGTMRREQQMPDGLAAIIKDSKLKLPDRRHTFMYDSPAIQNSREMANMEMISKKQQNARILREEVIETAQDTNTHTPDVGHLAAALQQMNAMGAAQAQQQENFNRINAQEQARQAAESRAMLERMAAEMTAQRSKDRVAEDVTRLHRDAMHTDARLRQEAAMAAGVPVNVTNNYDQTSNTTHNVTNNTIDPDAETTASAHRNMIYEMTSNFMKDHHAQFAAYAAATDMSAARAMAALVEMLEKRHAAQSTVNAMLAEQLANPMRRDQFDQGPAPPGSGSAAAAVTLPSAN